MRRWAVVLSVACASQLLATSALAEQADTALLNPRAAIQAPRAVESKVLGLCHGDGGLIAVGTHGDILLGKAARSWQQMPSPVDILLTRCAFADAQHGWAVGHSATILHTSDGGQHWQVQNYHPELGKPLMAVVAIDAQHAVAVGAFGLMMRTNDGGKTWTTAPTDLLASVGPHLNDITKLADGRLVVVGEGGLIAVSADGGATWSSVKSPYDGTYFGAIPWGNAGLMVFGIGGNVYATEDITVTPPAAKPATKAAAAGKQPARTTSAARPNGRVAATAAEPAPARVQWKTVMGGGGASLYGGLQISDHHAVLVGISGEVIQIGPDLAIKPIPVNRLRRVLSKNSSVSSATLEPGAVGSFTAVASFDGKLVLGGEDGVVTVSQNAAAAGENQTTPADAMAR